jgi:hypothetical protein
MSRRADTLNQRLRELDPCRSAVGEEAAPEELLRTILASGTEETRDLAGQPRHERTVLRWRSRRALAPLAAAAVVLALALVVGLPGGGSNSGAGGALDNVAAAAAAEPPLPELPYLYLKTRAMSVNTAIAGGEAWSVYETEVREEWSSPDGSGHVRIEEQPPAFVGPGDRASWEAAGSPNFLPHGFTGSTTEKDVAAGGFEDASDLPADPDLLAQRLRDEAEESHKSAPVGARMLDLIAEDLRNPAVDPQQRAALYRAAQEVPGIEYLGKATDPAGRQGVAIGVSSSYSGEPTTYSLIYDPESTDVLAYEVAAQHPVAYADSEGPLLTSATVYLESGSAKEPPAR